MSSWISEEKGVSPIYNIILYDLCCTLDILCHKDSILKFVPICSLEKGPFKVGISSEYIFMCMFIYMQMVGFLAKKVKATSGKFNVLDIGAWPT